MTLTQINKAGLDEIALDHVFTIGASGSSAYTFQGEGLNGTVNNPTLYLTRGKTYRFENGSGGHPIRIQSTSGASGTAYNTGVTNNAGSGTVIVEVQHDAPDVLYYQCTSHAAMNGILYITGALSDGGVTTAKLAADAVTGAKIADDTINSEHYVAGSIDAAHLATNSVSNAKIVDLDITGSKIQTNAVDSRILANDAVANANVAANAINTAEITDDAITQAKIAANAVDTTELAVGAVTHDQLADNTVDADHLQSNAVTTAKIADGAVSAAKLGGGITENLIANDAVTNSKIAANAVTSAEIASGTIVNAQISGSAAIAGTKIAPNFGSQNIETTGNITCDGEFQPHWIGHQSQCAENTYNNNVYWKVAEITGSGGEGGQIDFYGTNDYSGLGHNGQASRTTLVIRCLTNNQLGGTFWTNGGPGYGSLDDIRWKYTGSNNVYEIWIKKGAYNNVVPHVTGSFDYVQTFGSTTGSGTAPSGSTAFQKRWTVGDGSGSSIIMTTTASDGVVFNGKRVFSQSGYSAMNVTYSFDVPCADDSGNGQFFYVIAGHTHYNHSYAAIRISHFCTRGQSIVDTQNYANFTSGYGGSWSVSKPSNTTFRLIHNAGTYTYSGYYHVTVMAST